MAINAQNSNLTAKDLFKQFTEKLNNLDTESEESKKDFDKYSISNASIINNVNTAGRNVQEIFGLSGNSNKFSYNCIDHLQVDHEDYMDIVNTSTTMQDTISKGELLLPTFKYLHEDIFYSLYLYNPEILPPDKMHIQSYMNRSIITKVEELQLIENQLMKEFPEIKNIEYNLIYRASEHGDSAKIFHEKCKEENIFIKEKLKN